MKILTVVGARPNFMKAAPIVAAIREHNQATVPADRRINHLLLHTGQHYDAFMSDSFFSDLNLPPPDICLGVGSGSHASQTAEIIKRFEEVLLREHPDVVIVVGDVNSTLGCALVTAKISFDSAGKRPLLAHVEAGLRSNDRSMPEEVNRVLTDHVADFHFVTEQSAVQNLLREGLPPDGIHFVGNTMIDSLLAFHDKADASTILERLSLSRSGDPAESTVPYALLTLHRPSNVDSPGTFRSIIAGLTELAAKYPIIFPVHPRTQRQIRDFGMESEFQICASQSAEHPGRLQGGYHTGITLTNPLGYLDFLCLMKHAMLVVTDSGGIQEETTCLGIPCITVRNNTERPVTLECGTNVLSGTMTENIVSAVKRQILRRHSRNNTPPLWDGHAATRIVEILFNVHDKRTSTAQPDSLALVERTNAGATRPSNFFVGAGKKSDA